MNDFNKGLTKWFEKPAGQEYIAFKKHFTTAQNNLRRVRGPNMQSGILRQQANLISNSILNQLKDEQKGYVNAVSAVEQKIIQAVGNSTPEIIDKLGQRQLFQPSANTVSLDTVMLEVLKLLKELKEDVKENKQKRNNDNNKNDCNNNSNRKNHNNNDNNNTSNDRGRNQQQKKRKQIRYNVSKYCWLCGATNHPSKFYKKKKRRHKSEATFSNQLGGLIEYCQVIT